MINAQDLTTAREARLPPPPFVHRVAVPVAISTRLAPQCVLLAHLRNNYANSPTHLHGKIPMTELFSGDLTAEKEVKLSSFNDPKQKLFRFRHHIRNHFLAMRREIRITAIDILRAVKRATLGPKRKREDAVAG